jgi:hypothetical protein
MKMKKLQTITRDDVLSALGLQSRRGVRAYLGPVAGAMGLGMLIGAGLGLLLAPRSGRELREQMTKKMNGVGARARRHNNVGTGTSNKEEERGIEIEAT